MIRLKNTKQIDGIRASCKMLTTMFNELLPLVQVGVETRDLDRWTQEWIRKGGGTRLFKVR